jgi:hypothetical protein
VFQKLGYPQAVGTHLWITIVDNRPEVFAKFSRALSHRVIFCQLISARLSLNLAGTQLYAHPTRL